MERKPKFFVATFASRLDSLRSQSLRVNLSSRTIDIEGRMAKIRIDAVRNLLTGEMVHSEEVI